MQEVKASGLKPDTALLNALIRALGSGGLAKEAQGVFRTMVCCGPVSAGIASTWPSDASPDVPMIPPGEHELRVPLKSKLAAMVV